VKLYDIPREIELFEDRLINGGGELTPELEAEWAAFIAQGKDKLEAAAFVIKSIEDSADICKTEVKRLQARAASNTRNADRLRDLTLCALKAMGGKLKTALVSMWIGRTGKQVLVETKEGTDLVEVEKTHPQFIRVKREVNLSALKEAIEGGAEIPACFIVRHVDGTEYLRIN